MGTEKPLFQVAFKAAEGWRRPPRDASCAHRDLSDSPEPAHKRHGHMACRAVAGHRRVPERSGDWTVEEEGPPLIAVDPAEGSLPELTCRWAAVTQKPGVCVATCPGLSRDRNILASRDADG